MSGYQTHEELDQWAREAQQNLWEATHLWVKNSFLNQGLSEEDAIEAADTRVLEVFLTPEEEEEEEEE